MRKYLQINSAVPRHAVTLTKSACTSPSFAECRRFTARIKDVTAVPDGVVFSSGSAVSRPPRIALLMLKFAMVLSLPLISA